MTIGAKWGPVLATMGMLFLLLQLNLRQNDLQWECQLARQDLKDYQQLDLRHAKLKRQVARAWRERQTACDQLFEWLAGCTSRQDYIVREGPWIVASELRPKRQQVQRVGFYVPQGEHALKFATKKCREDGRRTSQSIAKFFQQDTRRFSHVVAIELPATPQVFELQLVMSQENLHSSLTLRLLGRHNALLDQRVVRLPANCRDILPYEENCLPKLNYPSELDTEQSNWEYFCRSGIPKTELLHLSATGADEEKLGIRFWIESFSPGCMSALKAACYRDNIAGIRQSYSAVNSYHFDDLFEPYVDSGRYQFRDSAFFSPIGLSV
ncbi:MAG: hypothetical protein R3C09_26145, partial [Pirellulaceae bacterium]